MVRPRGTRRRMLGAVDMAIVYLSKAVPLVSDLVLVSTVNDRRGHAAVLAVYDEAIRLAEEAPGPAGVAGG
jgi:hypothetical protein